MKKTILVVLILLAALAAVYIYREYNRKPVAPSEQKADHSMDAARLISLFEENETDASKNYTGKILEVTGVLASFEQDEKRVTSLSLGPAGSSTKVRCIMAEDVSIDSASLIIGNEYSLKGFCTGFNRDELLGSDIMLNDCAITGN